MNQTSSHVLVVGGGTAGSVLAVRLSEDPSVSVTVLEGVVAGLAGADFDFEPRGARDLKGVPGRWELSVARRINDRDHRDPLARQ